MSVIYLYGVHTLLTVLNHAWTWKNRQMRSREVTNTFQDSMSPNSIHHLFKSVVQYYIILTFTPYWYVTWQYVKASCYSHVTCKLSINNMILNLWSKCRWRLCLVLQQLYFFSAWLQRLHGTKSLWEMIFTKTTGINWVSITPIKQQKSF